ncbi:MAG: elongation factor G [Clostridiales bacterium]|jgi:elongation factor G|nr:elongation factor G [Clostridiales bacterium]
MKVYSANEIRNIAVMGHSGCGKTTLMEAALHVTKVTSRMGRTEDGNTASDYDAEEIRRKVSVSASMIPIEWKNSKINFMDTPGYFDFVGAAKEALHVADAVLILANAKSGIEVGTELAWESSQNKARVIFINGMDDEHADFFRVVNDMKSMFGTGIAPLMLPFKEGEKLAGYVETLTGKAFKFEGGACDVPADMASVQEENHAALVEAIAETDEELMEIFFESGTLSPEEMTKGLRIGIANGSITPVLCGVATKMVGVEKLLDMLVTELPPASELTKEITADKNGEQVKLACDASGPVCAFVFKTISDPFVGPLSLFRVYSGTVKKDTPLFNSNKEAPEKAGHMFIMRGKDQLEASEIKAGDIGAIAKLSDTNTQDTLATKAAPFKCAPIEFPESLLAMAVSAKSKGDADKLSDTIKKLLAEDKTLKFLINKETKQTVIHAIGDGQLDVLVNRLKTRYKMEVELKTPLVPYRETIKGKSDVKGKFVKQSGGGGQYGIVDMKFEPLGDIAKAYVFEEVVVGGNVPKQYFPAVDKGLQESVQAGPVAAYPVVGVKAILYDGKYHAVDSSELAFKMAAKIAFKDGFLAAKPTILEPVMKVTVNVPENYTGDIMGDMNKRRGRILGMDKVGKKQVINAEAPHSEMLKYAIDLRSMTQGRGSFAMEFERYDEAPADVQQKVVAARKLELEAMREKE